MAVMRIDGLVSGNPSPFDGEYLKEYDPCRDGMAPDGRPMLAHIVTTPVKAEALHAPAGDLLELWRAVDQRDPRGGRVEPDGALNRPLTAFTVTIE